MEVLNKNQRQTAIWRMVGLGMVILAINAAILFAIHRAYSNVGNGPMDELKRQLQACQTKATGAGAGQASKMKELETKVKNLETEKAAAATKFDLLKMRNEFLEKDLNNCKMMLSRPPSN